MGSLFPDRTKGGPGVRASQRRSGRHAPPRQPLLPLVRDGDRVRWGSGIPRLGIVERVLPDETVDVRELGSGRLWRLSIAQISR